MMKLIIGLLYYAGGFHDFQATPRPIGHRLRT